MSMSDNISRQAAIDALADYIHNVDRVIGTGHLSADDCKDAAISVLADLPSAGRTGHWEIYVISPFDGEGCRCSKCGYEGAPYWDYCPNCGADMRGEQE